MDVKNSRLAINELIEDYNFVKDKLLLDEPSTAQNIQRHLTKMFILSCGSHYEAAILNSLREYSAKQSKKYKLFPQGFDEISAISFFKMFDFGRERLNGVGAFLSPFKCLGLGFKDSFVGEIKIDADKTDSMMAFQEICSMRNAISHNDLITSSDASSKSFEDIKNLHDKASVFVELLVSKFT